MLLLGFAGAFRSAELAGLNVEDVRFTSAGLEVLVRRSKEDQLGRGAYTAIPWRDEPGHVPCARCARGSAG